MGAVSFLEKPFDATELADAIESAFTPSDGWGGTPAVESADAAQ